MSMYVELSSVVVVDKVDSCNVCPACKLGTLDEDCLCSMCTFDGALFWTKGGKIWVSGLEDES